MVIIDLIGWITFALLLIGAGWAAWRVWADLGAQRAREHAPEQVSQRVSSPEPTTTHDATL